VSCILGWVIDALGWTRIRSRIPAEMRRGEWDFLSFRILMGASVVVIECMKNPGAGEIFRTCPDQRWGPASLLYKGTGTFPVVKRPGVVLTTHYF
jgi:hypothetical protein